MKNKYLSLPLIAFIGLFLLNLTAFPSMERDIEEPGLPEQKLPLIPIQKIEEIIQSVKEIPSKDFPTQVKDVKAKFKDNISSQKDFCEGKYDQSKKLDRQERKVCLQKLRLLVKQFSDELIKGQKNYMDYVHRENRTSLDETSKSLESELNNEIFSK